MSEKRLTVPDVRQSKGQRKLVVITAYDASQSYIAESAGADMILVGDSLGMVVLGLPDTVSVTMDQMIHHTAAVSRSANRSLVIGDLPFLSYQVSAAEAVTNAGRFLKEGRAQAVKLEGGREVAANVRAIVDAGIPVMGHLGLTPQHVARLGGFKVQAKTASAAKDLLDDALALVDAGCFAVVLECVPSPVAEIVTKALPIPTIGIGAGPHCDGQVLVYHDVLGLYDRFTPKFVKRYAEIGAQARQAIASYAEEVRSGAFPDSDHSFNMSEVELEALRAAGLPGIKTS